MNLKPEQYDVLRELINVGVSRAAGGLNGMLDHPVKLQVPHVKIFYPQKLREELEGIGQAQLATVRMSFKGSFSGAAALVFPTSSALKLVNLLSEEELGASDLDSVRIGTLTEVGNIVINGVMGSIGNLLTERLNYSIPMYSEETLESLVMVKCSDPNAAILLAQTRFIIEKLQIEGDIILLFESSFDVLLAAVDRLLERNLE